MIAAAVGFFLILIGLQAFIRRGAPPAQQLALPGDLAGGRNTSNFSSILGSRITGALMILAGLALLASTRSS